MVFAVLATRLRLATGEAVALLGAIFAIHTARFVAESLMYRRTPPFGELTFFFLLGYVPLLGLSWWLTSRRERRFLTRWRAEAGRHRERVRMKRELEYARQIQLSMLPRAAPDVGWLDIAALSLPATEVGGDYYDYFELDDSRLAVVLGDVTGHGVASGLVLSGVRSSLNLLHEDLDHPRKVLERVNSMLKRTSTPRMLMTLVLAVLDRRERSMAVATAGHPPVLVLRAETGIVEEVGRGSFPLGAIAGETYPEQRCQVAPGDVLLLYSDGLVEATDADGEQYGWGRLSRELSRLAGSASAREIRDALLRDVWSFKGEVEQLDDVTMVVIRVVDEGSLAAVARSEASLSFDL
jgi:sigma-B regulation protein RsbU (phosphoserine phosphatase)